jgi:hypothetical protein
VTVDSFRRHRTRGALVGSVVLGALVLMPGTALAQPFGPGACGGYCYYADNGNETFYYDGLTVGDISSTETGRSRLAATDMTTQLQTASYNGDTDILVSDDYVPNDPWSAWWYCSAMVSGSSTKCNQGHIVINLSRGTANVPLTCQEIGHAVGLDHSTSTGSCMYQDNSKAASNYDTHDKGHINGYY